MTTRAPAFSAILTAIALAGCSSLSSMTATPAAVTASAIPEPPKVDPACPSLAQQIATLKSDGITDKVAQAAIKKYKLTPADLTKLDQLNKTSADFEQRCGKVPVQTAISTPAPATPPAAATAAATPAKAKAAATSAPAAGAATTTQ